MIKQTIVYSLKTTSTHSVFSVPLWYLLIMLAFCFTACQSDPVSDMRLFKRSNLHAQNIAQYTDTKKVLAGIQGLPQKSEQLDSLLIITDQLKGYDYAVALLYAREAYDLATQENWDLQRAISLYYIALMKRRIQTWGGGIEDALVDAEMSQLLFERLGRNDWLVRVYNLIGIIHFRQYERNRPLKLKTARSYFARALQTFQKTDLAAEDATALEAEILHDFGTTYFIDNRDSAMILYQKALAGHQSINNLNGVFRIKDDIAEILLEKKELQEAESLLQQCLNYGLSNNEITILSDAYLHLSDLRIIQFKKEGNTDYFYQAVDLLNKRLALQEGDKYHSYQRLGYAYNRKALFHYKNSKKFTNPDSVKWYYDLAYQQVDSTVTYYKIAIEEARTKGVLTVMDNLVLNIFNNCIDKQLEGKGDCKDILGKNTAKFLRESYKIVVDQMTANLTQSNYRIREMERLESDRMSAQKRREWLLIGLAILLLSTLIFLLFLQKSEKKKLRAQMEALRAQINPHFMSNSLNAIESLVNLGENEAASKYLIHFSRLSRRILNSSRNPQTSLANELQTLKHFLELEQLRFRDKLNYKIDLSPGLEPELIEVPAMILQPYVENAIWHGIKPKDSPGLLQIRIERNGKHLVCLLEDDGVGRKKSQELQANSFFKEKSHGMKITEERLKVAGKTKKAKVEIIDLHDTTGASMGTRVIVRLPFKLIKKKK